VTPPLPANVISAGRVPSRTPFAWIRKRALTSCEDSASSGDLRFYRLPSWCGHDSTDQLRHDLLGPLRNPRGVEYLASIHRSTSFGTGCQRLSGSFGARGGSGALPARVGAFFGCGGGLSAPGLRGARPPGVRWSGFAGPVGAGRIGGPMAIGLVRAG
jgi:hypothetical protein